MREGRLSLGDVHLGVAFFDELAEAQRMFGRCNTAPPPPAWPPDGSNVITFLGFPVIVDPDAVRPYLLDAQGRRWLLDGSGDVA